MRSPDIALSKSKRKRLAETIADLVASTSLEVGEETTIRYDPQRGNWKSWPKEIDDIFVEDLAGRHGRLRKDQR